MLTNYIIGRPAAKLRVFQGLAGSPLSHTVEILVPVTPTLKRGRGRPAKYSGDVKERARQTAKAYRDKKRDKEGEALKEVNRLQQIDKIDSTLDYNFGNEYGQGCGPIITGGYDSNKIEMVYAAHCRDLYGRKVKPEGHGADDSRCETYSPTWKVMMTTGDDNSAPHRDLRAGHLQRHLAKKLFCPLHNGLFKATRKAGKSFKLACSCERGVEPVWNNMTDHFGALGRILAVPDASYEDVNQQLTKDAAAGAGNREVYRESCSIPGSPEGDELVTPTFDNEVGSHAIPKTA